MVTEGQKYISAIYRSLGLAFLTPLGSIGFKYLVLEEDLFNGRVLSSLLSSAFGWLIIYLGYNILKENKNDK